MENKLRNKKPLAIVLLSGGLDSTTVLAIARTRGFEITALSFDYGQKNRLELERAGEIARKYDVEHYFPITIDLRVFGGSSLTGPAEVERHRPFDEIGTQIPSTYVPARNTLFLSYALSAADALGAADIFIGINAVDSSGYPDCRPEFINAYEQMARLATKSGTGGTPIRIHAPLLEMDKSEIVRTGIALGVDYSLTNTCYDPASDGVACGTCDACRLRQKGFHSAGYLDPVNYRTRLEAPEGENLDYPSGQSLAAKLCHTQ